MRIKDAHIAAIADDPEAVDQPVDEPALKADELDDGPLLRAEQLVELTTLDMKTIDRLILRERFPKPVQLSDRRRAWKRRDVRSWLADPLGWASF